MKKSVLRVRLWPVILLMASLGACATGQSSVGSSDDSVVADYLKGRFAVSQQQFDVAARSYESAAASQPKNASILRNAFFYELASGDVERAGEYARKLLRPEYSGTMDEVAGPPRNVLAASLPTLTVAALQMSERQYDDALATLEQPMDTMFARSLAYLMRAWALYETQGPDAGLAALDETGTAIFMGFTPLHRALMLERAGREQEAGEAYRAALATYSSNLTVIAFARFTERTGSRDEALELYRSMAQDTGFLRRAGRLGLARMGAPLAGETPASLRQARRRLPPLVQNGSDGAGIAFFNFAWGSWEQAANERSAAARAGLSDGQLVLDVPLAFARLAAYMQNDFGAAHYLVGAILSEYDMTGEARASFNRVGFNSAYTEYAVIGSSLTWEDEEDSADALALLEDFVESDPLTPQARKQLAQLLSREERYDEADMQYTLAIQTVEQTAGERSRAGQLWHYYFLRGATRLENDQWSAGEADLKKAIELSPDQPFVLNYLGYSWAERGENLEEAFAMIEKALELVPGSGAITDSLGWAYYQLGQYEKAVQYLERAVRLEPADPVITDHLGDAYWRLGRQIEARFEWRRVLTLEEADEEIKQAVRRKLEVGLLDASPVTSASQ